ncbi:hypothetical protein EOL16_05825, partial [Klebsiella pneumoniae]
FGFAENTDDLFVGKTLLHGDVLMWLMKTLLTSGCTNQRGAGHPVYFWISSSGFFITPTLPCRNGNVASLLTHCTVVGLPTVFI